MISGAILLVKPEPAIYKHLVEKTGIVPAESVFIDDLLKNVIAARECGLHAIQFRDAESCREELRTYLPQIPSLTQERCPCSPPEETSCSSRPVSRWRRMPAPPRQPRARRRAPAATC